MRWWPGLLFFVMTACVAKPLVRPSPAAPAPAAPVPASPVAVAAAEPAPAPPPRSATAGRPITATQLWNLKLTGVGTSSIRTADMNGDGVLDVVVGGGLQGQSGWVHVVDGATGKLLWDARFKEEFYATPALADVTGDGVPEVFIGGRDFDFHAVEGKTGQELWSLRAVNPGADLPRKNMNGGMPVGDQDGDGQADLVVSQGGAYDDMHRLPGRIFVISGKTGKLLANSTFPDLMETYSLPTLVTSKPLTVVQGSGGESLGGHLYRFAFEDGRAVQRWSAPSGKLGVVASPLFTRIGGVDSAVAVFYDGHVVRFDAATSELFWDTGFPGFEARASPAPGRFGGGGGTDVVATMSKGVFPVYDATNEAVWLDGVTGEVIDRAESGKFSASSPLVVDFDGDGFDETLTIAMSALSIEEQTVISTVTVYDGHKGKAKRMELKVKGAGWATPAIADLDGDGRLDLVFACTGVLYRYALKLEGGPPADVRWGEFRGPLFTGQDLQQASPKKGERR